MNHLLYKTSMKKKVRNGIFTIKGTKSQVLERIRLICPECFAVKKECPRHKK